MPRVHRLSFSATGTPASGPGSRPAATAASTASACGQRLVGQHGQEGVELAVARRDGGQRLLGDLPGRALGPTARSAASSRAPSLTAPRRRCAAPGSGRPRPTGAAASTSSRSRLGRGSSARSTFSSGDRVGRGRQMGQVERGHVGGVVEHRAQLGGEEIDLLVAQVEAGQPRPRG